MAEDKKDQEKKSEDKQEQFVTRDMMIGDVVQEYPKAAFVMMQYGLHCIGCHVSAFETIEQGCLGHGMPPHVLDEMLEDVNAFIAEELQEKKSKAAEPASQEKAGE